MDNTSLIIMAIVWGGLFYYFLVPVYRKGEAVAHCKMNFAKALKQSFVKVTFHKKAILALTLIVITLLVTLWSQNQNDIYNEIHGVSSQSESMNYPLWEVVYSAIIYLLMIIGKSIKLLRKPF